ncbi:hypothetical protein BCV70DRAFT_209025 [Testicularia cyperi]|uniref:Uncharacterized protein n=1 Tax=Testicularia cyperi TaxID=1882483 RepID=A0A317XFA2_9BASI|nr:hypothetical protein BCV70DRAFT_209025 [Testicularia cyperi]
MRSLRTRVHAHPFAYAMQNAQKPPVWPAHPALARVLSQHTMANLSSLRRQLFMPMGSIRLQLVPIGPEKVFSALQLALQYSTVAAFGPVSAARIRQFRSSAAASHSLRQKQCLNYTVVLYGTTVYLPLYCTALQLSHFGITNLATTRLGLLSPLRPYHLDNVSARPPSLSPSSTSSSSRSLLATSSLSGLISSSGASHNGAVVPLASRATRPSSSPNFAALDCLRQESRHLSSVDTRTSAVHISLHWPFHLYLHTAARKVVH